MVVACAPVPTARVIPLWRTVRTPAAPLRRPGVLAARQAAWLPQAAAAAPVAAKGMGPTGRGRRRWCCRREAMRKRLWQRRSALTAPAGCRFPGRRCGAGRWCTVRLPPMPRAGLGLGPALAQVLAAAVAVTVPGLGHGQRVQLQGPAPRPSRLAAPLQCRAAPKPGGPAALGWGSHHQPWRRESVGQAACPAREAASG